MLVILGNRTEFERVVQLLNENLNFDKDINVSVFETNIRSIKKSLNPSKLVSALIIFSKF